MKKITLKPMISLMLIIFITSCSDLGNYMMDRILIGKSEDDQSSIWDSNGDGKVDVERWYRGSSIVYEKIDRDFDGFWDCQGRRHSDGSFTVYIEYPKKKYSVETNHIFYASEYNLEDYTISARRGDPGS